MEQLCCSNCEAAVTGDFCGSCGQRAADPALMSVRAFLVQSIHELTDVDSKFIATLKKLLGEPGGLTRDYFEGKRQRYVAPTKLYLVVSAIFFLVAWSAYVPAELLLPQLRADPRFAAVTEAPPAVRERLIPQLIERAAELNAWFRFLSVVGLAAFMKLLLIRRRLLYVQHLVFALHYYAFDFFFYSLLAFPLYLYGRWSGNPMPQGLLSISYLLLFAYLLLAVKRAYQMKTPRAAAVALAAFIGDVVLSVLAGAFSMALAFKTIL